MKSFCSNASSRAQTSAWFCPGYPSQWKPVLGFVRDICHSDLQTQIVLFDARVREKLQQNIGVPEGVNCERRVLF